MTTDYEATHLTDDERYVPKTKEDKEELRRLEKYMELCSMGDRPQSPSAAKLRRYLYLKRKGTK